MRSTKGRPPEKLPEKDEQIPECLAYHLCRGKEGGADCNVCLNLSPEGYREHARGVLAINHRPNP